MRKLYMLMAAVILLALNAGAAVDLPYSSGSFTEENKPSASVSEDGWSYKDYGVADSSWSNATNFPYEGMYPVRLGANTYSQNSDVWLVSPAFNVKKGNDYTISFATKSQAALSNIQFDMFFTADHPVESKDIADKIALSEPQEIGQSLTTTYTVKDFTFTASESGVYRFALRFQGKHGTPVFVADIKITETDNGGGDDSGDDNGDDNGDDDGDDEFDGISLPYTSGAFTNDNTPKSEVNDSGWSYKEYGVAGSSWSNATNFAYNGMTPVRLGASNFNNQISDIWLVSPKFKMKKGNEYNITFYTKSQAALNTTSFDAYLTDVNPVVDDEMAEKTASYYKVELGGSFTTTYSIRNASFKADKDGNGYIALRFQGIHNTPLFVADINITEIDNGGGEEEEPEPDHECDAAVTTLPYASSLTSDGTTFVDGWTVINVKEGSKTWQPCTDSDIPSKLGAQYTYDTVNEADDYLISPSIHLEKGKEYVIGYGYKASYNNEKMEIVASLNPDMSDAEVIDTKGTVSNYTNYYPKFTPKKTGDYYIAYHAISPANKFNIIVGDFLVARASDSNPKAATELKAVAAPNRELKVSLTWKNPTQNIFNDLVELTKVEVYRNESLVATLGGDAQAYDDILEEAGEYTYSVIVYSEDLASAPASISAGWVGPLAPKPVPVTFSINSQSDFNDFTAVAGENSTVSSTQHWRYSSNGAQFTCGGGATEDDYLMAPPVAIEEAGLYKIILNTRVETPSNPYNMEILLCNSLDVTDVAQKIATITEGLTNKLDDKEFNIQIASPGTYYVVAHAALQNREGYAQHYYVKSVSVEKFAALPGVATDVRAEAATDKTLSATVSWINPVDTDFEDLLLSDGEIVKAVVYRDGVVIAEVEDAESLVPGQEASYVDSDIDEAGEHTYKVEIYNENGKSKTPAAEVTVWVGPGILIDSENGLSFTGADFAEWEKYNAEGSYGGWYHSSSSNTFEYYRYASADAVDDWTVSPRIEFEYGKVYEVEISSYEYTYGSKDDYSLDFHVGSHSDHTQLPKLGDKPLINLKKGSTADNMQVDTFYIGVSLKDNGPSKVVLYDDDQEIEEGSEGGESDSVAGSTKENPIAISEGTQRIALHGAYIPEADIDFYLHQVKITDTGVTTGIETVEGSNAVTFDGLGVRFDGKASVAVYNAAGMLVGFDSLAEGSFDLSALESGLYLIKVVPEKGKAVTLKVLK